MVTNIGNTTLKSYIQDATPTWKWFLPYERIKGMDKLPYTDLTRMNLDGGKSCGRKSFAIDNGYYIQRVSITNLTDYQNLKKALGFWEGGDVLLYLVIINEWGTNLAQRCMDRAEGLAGTLTAITGKLVNFEEEFYANETIVSVMFEYITPKP